MKQSAVIKKIRQGARRAGVDVEMYELTRYTATARRSGGWWMVQCDQLPGALSQVRSLAKAADVHREAIAFVSGQAADEIDIDVHASRSLHDTRASRLDTS